MGKKIKIIIFVLVGVLSITANSYAQKGINEQHIGVSMRLIGHELLLNSGDSVSRVLPIEQKENQYKIKFESPFQFDPAKLVKTVNEIIEGKNIAKSYLVEVGQEGTDKVIYSYEMANSESEDLIPCGGRVQPKDNYNLSITILETDEKIALNNLASRDKSGNNYWIIAALIMALLSSIGFFVFIQKKRRSEDESKSERVPINHNIISIGKYQFDKINMELSYVDSKVELTGKEAGLLLLLHQSANETIEREQILKEVWGDEGDYVGRTLDVFISKLRKKLEADDNVKIVNIRGVGYKLVVGV
jgi:DNA-binding winged helix-turn-helix (wHTH) protein